MQLSTVLRFKIPKNMGVAPRYDLWNEKYEPWQHMKQMGRLAGTGFYIPPEWYNHFRMFPPIHHNFQQERTLNPQNRSEPTQDDHASAYLTADRLALRDELGRKSRQLAAEGMRYYNLFWIQKPMDQMEKAYYALRRQGLDHELAVRSVLQTFYDTLAVKKRQGHIQAEEAKLSGSFITMREATTVLKVLAQLQQEQYTPHQANTLAKQQRKAMQQGDVLSGTLTLQSSSAATSASTPESKDDGTPQPDQHILTADALADLLGAEATADLEGDAAASRAPGTFHVTVTETTGDSLSKLRETATDRTGNVEWYSGETPFYTLDPSSSVSTPNGGDGASGTKKE